MEETGYEDVNTFQLVEYSSTTNDKRLRENLESISFIRTVIP